MNKHAKLLKMENTNYTNPHGMQENDSYSTVYDQALLSHKIIQIENLKKIVSTRYYEC